MLITVSEFHQELRDSIYNHVFINAGNFDANGCTKIITKAIKSSERKRKRRIIISAISSWIGDERISIGIAEIIPRKDVISFARPHINHEHICRVEEFCESNKYPYNHFLKFTISKRSKKVGRVSGQVANFIVGILYLFSEHWRISSEFISLSINPYPNYDGFLHKTRKRKYWFNFSSKALFYGVKILD